MNTRPMSTREAMAAWAAFLEAQPSNIALTIPALLRTQERLRRLSWNIRLPPIDIHCDRDGGFRRFSADQDSLDLKNPPESYSFITYRCRNCEETTKTFAVMIHWNPLLDDSNAEVMKLGEYPPFSAPISPRIKKLLSPSDLELFRKGNRATDQGLGIGAASYFRRVVENQWSHLVTEIKQAAERVRRGGSQRLRCCSPGNAVFARRGNVERRNSGEAADSRRPESTDVALSASQPTATRTDGRTVPEAGCSHPDSTHFFAGEHCGCAEGSRQAPRCGTHVIGRRPRPSEKSETPSRPEQPPETGLASRSSPDISPR